MGEVFTIMQNTEFLSFLIRTVTVGTGISPVQQTRADFTADVEFHQPPKNVGNAHLKNARCSALLICGTAKSNRNKVKRGRRSALSLSYSV